MGRKVSELFCTLKGIVRWARGRFSLLDGGHADSRLKDDMGGS